jgi:hypothetical protein
LVELYNRNIDKAWKHHVSKHLDSNGKIKSGKYDAYNRGIAKFMEVEINKWMDNQIKKYNLPEKEVYDLLLDSL